MGDKPVVLVTRKLPEEVEQALQARFHACLNPGDDRYSSDELLVRAQQADALMICHTEHLDRDTMMRLAPRVKVVANVSVGVDHCDLDAARERRIIVTNTPDVLSDATAEIAMLLMLGAARRAAEGERLVRTGEWRDWSPSFMVGTQVTGKRLGLVGMGRVGQVVARRARGFDMEVHYHNRRPLPQSLAQGAIYHENLDAMLPQCEFLSIHCPATPETRGLFDARRLALLPPGAILVNTSRGSAVVDSDLIAALREGNIAAAGLDVYNDEPNVDPRYRELWNTFLLPHVGSATRETRAAMGFRAIENLQAVFEGTEPRDRVA